MHRFHRQIFRERRRLALIGGCVTLAAFLIFSASVGIDIGSRSAALAALGVGLGAVLIALGVVMIAPGLRHALDTAGIATLLYAMAIIQVPGLSFHQGGHSLAAFVGFLVAVALLHSLMHGRWSDRLLVFANHVERATCLTWLDRDTLWHAACPSVETQDSYWDSTVHSIAPDPENGDALILSHHFDNGMMMDQRIAFEQVSHGKSFRYYYQTIGARPRGPQIFALVIEPREGKLALHLRWERAGYPARLGLMHWIDDWGGRVADRQLAEIEAFDTMEHPLPEPTGA